MTDLDFKLNKHFYENIDLVKNKTSRYKSRISRSKSFLRDATKFSKTDLQNKLKSLTSNPSPREAVFLLRNLLNSGVWIGQSTLRYLVSMIDFTNKGDLAEMTPSQASILKRVSQGNTIEEFSDEEIFKTIYNEIEYSFYYPDHKPMLEIPRLNCTLVLVPGVFNELFSSAAFERAAIHLQEKYGIEYFTPRVNGFKSCEHNAKLLDRQVKSYVRKHPKQKLWFICYSKGGLDSLHFLKENADFANQHILGISTIASPLLGSDHLNSRMFKVLNSVHNFSDTKIYKALNEKTDVMAKEFQKSISSTFQRPWLRKNHEKLPSKLFYTAIGFESEWYQSHVWMMLAKGFLKSNMKNDGVVDAENSLFPYYFDKGTNLGIIRGHHLVGTRSSYFCQEALLESLIIYLNYKGLVS
ncbi:lecithin:cholesterol acyltransferase domain protein [Bacteriovorax sp. Seq25_V]|uniref:lipase family alpha/beta hydrolase n=1 Tax=Bacteriovorax sp. Seq25_V TaxID=1201288 RepID=UPI000389F8DD|nr:lecithin:cholesterol acyltransferase domain protein [Bacteriovorax sp. Seq25_V]EQC43444.1 lecithin:cholesterol acyltransferase domain protein [Bacteriovorax sp. Seq25_V]